MITMLLTLCCLNEFFPSFFKLNSISFYSLIKTKIVTIFRINVDKSFVDLIFNKQLFSKSWHGVLHKW